MPLKKEEKLPNDTGYYEKNLNRHRYCNDFHSEGYRCTRPANHKPPHAAHIVRGNENAKLINVETDPTKAERWELPPGVKTDINVQIATW